MHYWSWGGKYIGMEQDGWLYGVHGYPIGFFEDNILYSGSGWYLGEKIMNKRLVVNVLRKNRFTKPRNIPKPISVDIKDDIDRYEIFVGHEDFEDRSRM